VFDAAVEVGVAAFMAGTSAPTDDAVVADLERSGVDTWLARRLVVFLPLAFGRRVLPGVEVSDYYDDGAGRHRLSEDPVFPWAAARVERAVKSEVERIGLRSSEVNAVSSALSAGSRMEDLVLSPVALPEPLPAPSAGDGGVPSPRAMFEALLGGHGFRVEQGKAGAMEVEAELTVHPRPRPDIVMVQLDVAVRHPDLATPWLVESVAGIGSTWREAIGQGMAKFERSVVHVLIAGLLDRGACADQVEWQAWQHPGGDFDVCLGPQLVLFSDNVTPYLGSALAPLREALGPLPLTRAVHSLRLFTCHDQGALVTNEVLLDGEPWPAGEHVTMTAVDPGTTDRIAARLFALLLPADPR
jgi:hypothetical protein